MLYLIKFGPHKGETHHLPQSQEASMLALLGFITPVEAPQQQPAFPPEGWSIVRAGKYNERIMLRFDDGHGGKVLLEKEPDLARTYIPPVGDEPDGHYEMRPAVAIPQNVLDEFRRLDGGPKGMFADLDAADLQRQKRAQQQADIDARDKLSNTYLAAMGAK